MFRISTMAGIATIATIVTTAACATNPVSGKKEVTFLSEAQEIEIGQKLDVEVRREMRVYQDPELQSYVERIGLRLAAGSHRPHLPWHFAIVDVPAVNAFALPGGYVYLTRGILAHLDTEAQVAGVLGHEIGHVTARHAAQAYTRAAQTSIGLTIASIFFPETRPFTGLAESGLGVLFLKYSRDDELEADRVGAEYAAREGWDPDGLRAMLTTLARLDEATDRRGVPNWLSTHPQPADRVQKIDAKIAELEPLGATEGTDREAYLRRIDGLVFGDSPEEGIVRGASFLHPVLRFALEFPEGWEVVNSAEQVVAQEPGNQVFLTLQQVPESRGRSLEDLARGTMSDAGFRPVDAQSRRINGLDAHVGVYRGRAPEIGDARLRAALFQHGREVYLLAGVSGVEVFPRADRDFLETIDSFRPLGAAEAAEIKPNRVDLYVVRPGDSWQLIAARAGQGNIHARTLAILNGYDVTMQPEPGARIKIVVAG